MELNKFDLDDFITEVNVQRDDKEKCEMEVTNKAMKFYKEYPCYDDKWEIRNGHLCYRFEDMSCLLLTADIITSISKPFNKSLIQTDNPMVSGRGTDIQNFILTPLNDSYMDLLPYYKAFAKVYYWIGNMYPVIWNYRPGQGDNDNWVAKLNMINECFDSQEFRKGINNLKGELIETLKNGRKSNQSRLYKLWIIWMKDELGISCFKDFIDNYMLNDMVTINNSNEIKVKEITKISDCKNIEDIRKFWINNTKIIIQRSYRIYKKMKGDNAEGDFTNDDKNNIISIFKTIFNMCNCNDVKYDELF